VELTASVDELNAVLDCVSVQIVLLEQLQREGHLVEADGPALPLLVSSEISRQRVPLHQIVPPSPADQHRVAPQSIDEQLVLQVGGEIGGIDLVFIAVAAGLVDGEGPPVVVAAVELPVHPNLIPSSKMTVLLNALRDYLLALLTHLYIIVLK
jgi:hypothetical protein